MNPRTRKAALYAIAAIAVIAILASANALAHSYAGLYGWAVHHRLTGWQAMSWPAEIDVFLAVGELALYVAYLDGWAPRQRIWPWATALTGLVVSVAGNIGHIQATAGDPVSLTDRLTAAASPLAAFAGLSVGLLVVRMTRLHAARRPAATLMLASPPTAGVVLMRSPGAASGAADTGPDPRLLRDATLIVQNASARGQRLSQRTLAREPRGHGHHFPNDHLRQIAKPSGWPATWPPDQPGAREKGEDMPEPQPIQARLQDASGLADTLAVSFDAFEAIRLAARSCVDWVPELFAAFMTTAGAAVEGREAITAASSLPAGPGATQPGLVVPGDSIGDAVGVLAALGTLLDSRLTGRGIGRDSG